MRINKKLQRHFTLEERCAFQSKKGTLAADKIAEAVKRIDDYTAKTKALGQKSNQGDPRSQRCTPETRGAVMSKHTPTSARELIAQAAPRQSTRNLTLYNPDKGLKSIAVAEAAEKHWRRAKDAQQLNKAVEAKVTAQAEYVVWRDTQEGAGSGGDRKSKSRQSDFDLPDSDPGHKIASRWRKKYTRKDSESGRTVIDEESLAAALNEKRLWVQRVCEDVPPGTVRGTEGTGEVELYTPAEYLELTREVYGGQIDLCPASNAEAQKVAKAKKYFTAADDGLVQEWNGRVYLNPPYHRALLPTFIDKLHAEIDAGRTKEAILLINNTTDTEAGQSVLKKCNAVCFTAGRIKFWRPGGQTVLPTQGQMFAYYGSHTKRFVDVFSAIGVVLVK